MSRAEISPHSGASRVFDVAATLLSLGTNKVAAGGMSWLKRHRLARCVLPAILLNEAFGVYRIWLAGGTMGWW